MNALLPGHIAELAALPFALSLLAVGMAHGAADGALLLRAAAGRLPGWLARVAAGYLLIDAAALTLLLLAPAATLLAFLGLTVWHFGRTAGSRHAAAPPLRFFCEAALLVLLPFVIRPAETTALFGDLVRLAGGDGGFPEASVPLAAAACAAAAAWLLLDLVREPARRGVRLGLLAMLLTAPLLLPPLASVGLLFLFLHAGPECLTLGRRLSPVGTKPLAAFARLHLLSLPLWLPVLAAVALLWSTGRAALPAAGPVYLTALFTLLACCVLTPAHEALRALLDPAADRRSDGPKTTSVRGRPAAADTSERALGV